MNIKIINIIGPSGAGKTTIANKALKSKGIPELISHTSRELRVKDNEIDGVSYYFTNKEAIQKMIDNDEVIEYTNNSGNLYCLSKKEVVEKAKLSPIVYSITDIVGNKHLKDYFGNENVYTVGIYNTIDVLKERLILRGESKATIEKRVSTMEEELNNKNLSDEIIFNDNFNKSVQEMESILNKIKLSL